MQAVAAFMMFWLVYRGCRWCWREYKRKTLSVSEYHRLMRLYPGLLYTGHVGESVGKPGPDLS